LTWATVEHWAVEVDPELAEIDRILDDDERFQLIKANLSQHCLRTRYTRRYSARIKGILRMLAVGGLNNLSYDKAEQ
jgi:hypothetical protein